MPSESFSVNPWDRPGGGRWDELTSQPEYLNNFWAQYGAANSQAAREQIMMSFGGIPFPSTFSGGSFQGPATGAEVGIFGSVVRAAGSIIGGILGGGGGGSTFGLPEVGPVLTPTAGQKGRVQATLIGGLCPPGRQLRRVKLGRDICVRKPRMNPLNPKALSRATKRIAGFHHFAVQAEKNMAAAFRQSGYRPAPRQLTSGRCGSCKKTKCSCGG